MSVPALQGVYDGGELEGLELSTYLFLIRKEATSRFKEVPVLILV